MSGHPHPTEIRVHQKTRILEIAFDDGAHFELPCELLRVFSPSAEVRGHLGKGAKLVLGKENVSITDIRPVGSYAIKIFFDDGHDSGLFDWRYLYDLGRRHAILWTIYLERLREAGYQRREPGGPSAESEDPGQP